MDSAVRSATFCTHWNSFLVCSSVIDMAYSNYMYKSQVHESVTQASAGEVDHKLWLPFKVCYFLLLFAFTAGWVISSPGQPRRSAPYRLRGEMLDDC